VQGHGHVHLGRGYEVHGQVPAVEDTEDVHQEAVSAGALVAVHVEYDDVVLDRDRSRTLGAGERSQEAGGARAEERGVSDWGAIVDIRDVVGEDDGTGVAGVHDVLDADRDACADDLLHGKRVDYLRTIKGQLSSLGGRNCGEQSGCRDFAGVRGEDTIHLFPDLQLLRLGTHGYECSTKIRVSTSNGAQNASRNIAKVSRNHWHFVATRFHLFAQSFSQVLVELVVKALGRRSEVDNMGEVDELRRRSAVIQQRGHVPTAQLLALAHNLVFGAVGNLLQVLRRLQNLGQALALGIDLLGEGSQYLGILNRVRGSLDMVGTDGLDNLIISAIALFLGSSSSAEEPVRGSLELRVVAACGADYSGAIVLEASSMRR
jgi:hypothetical protein